MKKIIYLLLLPIGFIVFIINTIKGFMATLYHQILYAVLNKDIVIADDILIWHKETISLEHIECILYGKSSFGRFYLLYKLKKEDRYDLFTKADIFYKRKHISNKRNITDLKYKLESFSLKVIPSLWLAPPIGLMGCTVSGNFLRSDFLTLSGDNENIFVHLGLDCDPSNLFFKIVKKESFHLGKLFQAESFKQGSTESSTKLHSNHQAYILNKTASIEDEYYFLPWCEGKFLFDDFFHTADEKQMLDRIIEYFSLHKDNLVEVSKNCIDRNNPDLWHQKNENRFPCSTSKPS